MISCAFIDHNNIFLGHCPVKCPMCKADFSQHQITYNMYCYIPCRCVRSHLFIPLLVSDVKEIQFPHDISHERENKRNSYFEYFYSNLSQNRHPISVQLLHILSAACRTCGTSMCGGMLQQSSMYVMQLSKLEPFRLVLSA